MTRVLAVVVARDGAKFLPRTLAGLRSQNLTPARIVGVDVASSDSSAAMLDSLAERVVKAPRRLDFGAAVSLGLEEAGGDEEWIWLLHDDVAPEPRALEELLAAAGSSDSIGILGPKLLGWDTPERLLEVGLTLGSDGSRHTGVAPGDIDQGQWDDTEDVLAVNTAGMLVRREIFDALGGFSPILARSFDDLEFCRRARLAGYRVRAVPAARARHAQAGSRGLRGQRPRPSEELAARWSNRILGSGRGRSVLVWLRVTLLGIFRGLYRLAAKEPRAAGEEFRAIGALPDRLPGIWSWRRNTRGAQRLSATVLAPLIADRRATRAAGRSLADPEEQAEEHRRETPGNTTGMVDSYSPLDPLGAPRRRLWTHPVAIVLMVLALVSVVSQYRLFGPGTPLGGALPATRVGATDLFAATVSGWQPFGLGQAVPADPLLAVLWPLSLLFFGNTPLALSVLWLLALPLAAGSAALAAGALTRRAWPRALAGAFWALAPTLLLALDDGRLGAVLGHIALPLLALGLVRARGAARSAKPGLAPGRGGLASHTAGAGAGLAAAVVAAGMPVLTVPIVLVILVIVLTAGRGRRLPMLWTALGLFAVIGPWLFAAVRDWPALLADPGILLQPRAGGAWQFLLVQPEVTDLGFLGPLAAAGAWVVVLAAAPLLLVALLALVRGDNGPLVWPIALVLAGLVVALASASLVTGADATALVSGYAGPGTAVVLLALLWLAAETVVPGGRFERPGRHRPFALAGTVLVSVSLVAMVAAGGLWSAGQLIGERGDVGRTGAPQLPALATDRYDGPLRQSTLVLRVDGDEVVGELRGPLGGTLLATSTIAAADQVEGAPGSQVPRGLDDAQRALGQAVATVTAGSGHDASPQLRDLGVGFIVIDDSRGEATTAEALGRSLDVTGGLNRLGETSSGTMWTVEGEGNAAPAYAVMATQDARLPLRIDAREVEVPEGSGDRTLYLAQRADPGWRATLEGRVLEAAPGGDWRQAWTVPEGGGTLTLEYRPFSTGLATIARAATLLVVLFVAIPLPGRRDERGTR